ncbi:MAG TPA: hypothetical protein VFW11_19830 [Cyclobacteriaceae bacterium]|nr:hypothetical protein [Cyclobacteriaceae bacterium]
MESPFDDIPEINEPLEQYLNSPAYKKSFKRVTISTLEEQENNSRLFSATLSPSQRLELLFILNKSVFGDKISNMPQRYSGKIYFDAK